MLQNALLLKGQIYIIPTLFLGNNGKFMKNESFLLGFGLLPKNIHFRQGHILYGLALFLGPVFQILKSF
jgi:hypothetical protein